MFRQWLVLKSELTVNVAYLEGLWIFGESLLVFDGHGPEFAEIERTMVLFALEDVEVLAFLNAFQCFRTVRALEDSIPEITVFGAKQAIAHLAEELPLITVVGIEEV